MYISILAPLSPDTHDYVRCALSLPLVQGKCNDIGKRGIYITYIESGSRVTDLYICVFRIWFDRVMCLLHNNGQ